MVRRARRPMRPSLAQGARDPHPATRRSRVIRSPRPGPRGRAHPPPRATVAQKMNERRIKNPEENTAQLGPDEHEARIDAFKVGDHNAPVPRSRHRSPMTKAWASTFTTAAEHPEVQATLDLASGPRPAGLSSCRYCRSAQGGGRPPVLLRAGSPNQPTSQHGRDSARSGTASVAGSQSGPGPHYPPTGGVRDDAMTYSFHPRRGSPLPDRHDAHEYSPIKKST